MPYPSYTTPLTLALTALISTGLLSSCNSSNNNDDTSDNITTTSDGALDIKDAIFTGRSADCASYANQYRADVLDIKNSLSFSESVSITHDESQCTLVTNSVPNHDFNDESASFAGGEAGATLSEVEATFNITRSPQTADSTTALSQRVTNAVFLNGVALDMLSAGCYDPSSPIADAGGNTAIGCNDDAPWLLDPLGTDHKFGADQHNAHTQPGGLYHYHGNPNALFDDNPGPNGSPVIGFAADGFPIYGSYFYDPNTGQVRKALSGYSLKVGSRGSKSDTNPGGSYDGTYVDDFEFTNAGDLDRCNGMTVDDQYGYYVTDAYPWVMKCFTGTPDTSFEKSAEVSGGPPAGRSATSATAEAQYHSHKDEQGFMHSH